MIRILRKTEDILSFIRSLEKRMPSEDAVVMEKVKAIIQRVRADGRLGLLQIRQELENIPIEKPLTLSRKEFEELASSCPETLVRAIQQSIDRVREYHQIQKDETRWMQMGSSRFASRVQPLDSVALYVPGGKAFYPSSVVMSAVPAQVAGVQRIVIYTPARSITDPVFAFTICALGIDEVHAVGGAQAVAAATFGVEGIERCDKIVGPGNIYVATAKQCLAGRIGIDGFAGPSEILILSDGTSRPSWIATDLLAQAEHDEDASAVLVTTNEDEALAVADFIQRNIEETCRERSPIARESLEKWGAICVVENRKQLVEIANQLNSEHLHIQTSCAQEQRGEEFWLNSLKGVGAIFLGRWSAESFGDYLAGPSHVLPTAATARFSSPLGVYDFIRRSSVLSLSEADARSLSLATASFADAEKLWAHAAAARLRGEKINESGH